MKKNIEEQEKKIFLPIRDRFKEVPTNINTSGTMMGIDMNELIAYTGDKPEECSKKLEECRTKLAEEFRSIKDFTKEGLEKYYTETKYYIYDLYSWDHYPQLWQFLDETIKPGMKVLDYGCGIGDIAIYAAELGANVTAVDLPHSETLKFAMWRIYNRRLGNKIKFQMLPEGGEKFDAIFCIDVLEHLQTPLRYAEQLGQLLKSRDSWMMITPTFGDDTPDKHYPQHLEENFWLREHFNNAMIALSYHPSKSVNNFYPKWHAQWKPTEEEYKKMEEEAKKQ